MWRIWAQAWCIVGPCLLTLFRYRYKLPRANFWFFLGVNRMIHIYMSNFFFFFFFYWVTSIFNWYDENEKNEWSTVCRRNSWRNNVLCMYVSSVLYEKWLMSRSNVFIKKKKSLGQMCGWISFATISNMALHFFRFLMRNSHFPSS